MRKSGMSWGSTGGILALVMALVMALVGGACAPGGGGAEPGPAEPTPPEAAPEGLTGLVLAPASARLVVGVPRQFTAYGEFEGGPAQDLTERCTWTSSDPERVEISNTPGSKGLATVHALGPVTLTAQLGDVRAELSLGGGCDYPEGFGAQLGLGQVVPPFGFAPAFGAAGASDPFSLADLYCDESVRSFVFMLGTAWCGACSAMAQRLGQESAAIEAAGGKVILVALEDADGGPMDSAAAAQHWGRIVGADARVLRVGDASSTPGAGFLTSASRGLLNGYPTTFIVRRSDMKIIAVDQPVLPVVQDPERDWTEPFEPPFRANCGPADEEPGEPNDTPEQATPLPAGPLAPGQSREVSGGICTPAPDFFAVNVEGPWRLTLNFTHALGDLDVFVWDVANDGPLQQGGQVIGSARIANEEQFEHAGPALVAVIGYNNASAHYRLTLEAL